MNFLDLLNDMEHDQVLIRYFYSEVFHCVPLPLMIQ